LESRLQGYTQGPLIHSLKERKGLKIFVCSMSLTDSVGPDNGQTRVLVDAKVEAAIQPLALVVVPAEEGNSIDFKFSQLFKK
jgi:hypothetical protein